jgi:general secretion pathway protein G
MMTMTCLYKDEKAFARSHRGARSCGFTLLELMVVLTLILILASFGMSTYHTLELRAHEATLRDQLFTMRAQIDRFTHDKQRGPESLEELVESEYLGSVPMDPFTGSDQTWQFEMETVSLSVDPAAPLGIVDVHSGCNDNSIDGTPYSNW